MVMAGASVAPNAFGLWLLVRVEGLVCLFNSIFVNVVVNEAHVAGEVAKVVNDAVNAEIVAVLSIIASVSSNTVLGIE